MPPRIAVAGVECDGLDFRSVIGEEPSQLGARGRAFKEVEGTIDEEDAVYEATRCLHCGTYCYDPDLKVARQEAAEEEDLQKAQ